MFMIIHAFRHTRLLPIKIHDVNVSLSMDIIFQCNELYSVVYIYKDAKKGQKKHKLTMFRSFYFKFFFSVLLRDLLIVQLGSSMMLLRFMNHKLMESFMNLKIYAWTILRKENCIAFLDPAHLFDLLPKLLLIPLIELLWNWV